ncbi:uncharacterized protein V1510DRAFT_360557 [Dipodascopsis tothii]|uniref:uncharacterized protein n=1 Tax=Dipodascopsis tothii TaxID=44089 RepID=UPI0034CD3AF9
MTTLGIDFTTLSVRGGADAVPVTDENDSETAGGCLCAPGTCCGATLVPAHVPQTSSTAAPPPELADGVKLPDNAAFRSLELPVYRFLRPARLLGFPDLAPTVVRLEPPVGAGARAAVPVDAVHPPPFVTPHWPHLVHRVPVLESRLLTAEDAPKRTYHFDLDVTAYPDEIDGVDFRVGGAVGICPPNDPALVQELLERLGVAGDADAPVDCVTEGGRWPTIWGEDRARRLRTTRRELVTWTVDLHGGILAKPLLRLLAEHTADPSERYILSWLCSKQGSARFCALRSAPYPPTLPQLLAAFPSSAPPLADVLALLPPLMPRFYSLSSDPTMTRDNKLRKVEIAVTVHETPEPWRTAPPYVRTGISSGFLERVARTFIARAKAGAAAPPLTVPLFRGLQANPLAKEFRPDGPMLLIGAGVGVAPFRGFVQRRLRNANCKNKVWVLQGCRDSLVDELYAGEWGVDDADIRKVIQSRKGTKKYVQDEVFNQADLVWSVISHPDGKVFVCGSSKGMGEGVEEALKKVAMASTGMSAEEATEFWDEKKRTWQYITETW